MRVLDLFAGLKGWSSVFEERGHECVSVDLNPKFDVTKHMDILEANPWDFGGEREKVLKLVSNNEVVTDPYESRKEESNELECSSNR